VQYADEKPDAPFEVRVYPGADGAFVLYEDEGEGYAYERGTHATTRLAWNDERQELTIEAREGTFPGLVSPRELRIVVVRAERGIGVEETSKPDRVVSYDGTRTVVSLQ